MIFEDILKNEARGADAYGPIIVQGVNNYRRKILATCFPKGVPDSEIPFFLAALRLMIDDFEGFAKRSGNHEMYMNAANDIVDVVNECTQTLTFTREVENG